jgi:hypothetical protein
MEGTRTEATKTAKVLAMLKRPEGTGLKELPQSRLAAAFDLCFLDEPEVGFKNRIR